MSCQKTSKRFAEFCEARLPTTDAPLDAWFHAYYGRYGWEWVEPGRSIRVLQGNNRLWRLRRLVAWERLVYEIATRFPTIFDEERLAEVCRGISRSRRTGEWTTTHGLAHLLSRWTSRPPTRLMVTRDTLRIAWCVPRSEWDASGRGAKSGRHRPARRPVQLSLPLGF